MTLPPAPQAVLLDLDDTLYAERSYLIGGIEAVADYLSARVAQSRTELVERTLQLLAAGRAQLFDRLLATLDLESPAITDAVIHVYRTHRPCLAPFGDVMPALQRLRAAGVGLGLVTDGKSVVQHNKISALGLERWLDVIVCTDDLLEGTAKPSPRPFAVALSRLQAAPDRAIYIGDDTAKDFLGPRALGMGTIRLDRKLPFPLQPHHDFSDKHLAHAICGDLEEAVRCLLSGQNGYAG